MCVFMMLHTFLIRRPTYTNIFRGKVDKDKQKLNRNGYNYEFLSKVMLCCGFYFTGRTALVSTVI